MKTRTNANSHGSQTDQVAAACKPIDVAGSRRARLMGASAIAGGTLRGLAIAAGMVTVFGAAPAMAQCFSGVGGNLLLGGCQSTAATGINSTAVGFMANATGGNATAYGNQAIANGNQAT